MGLPNTRRRGPRERPADVSWYRIDPVPPNPRYWPYGWRYAWRYLETWEQVIKAVDQLKDQFGQPAFNLDAFTGVEITMRVPERVMVEDRIFYPLARVGMDEDGYPQAIWIRDGEYEVASWDQFGEQDPDPARRLRRLRGLKSRTPTTPTMTCTPT